MTGTEGEGPAGEAVDEPAFPGPLTDGAELLLRQVHPTFFQDGEPTSQAFRPTAAHEGQLSVDRGSLTTAKDSFIRHTETFGLQSIGAWGVTVGEVAGQQLNTFPDERPDNPAHCFVDFGGLSRAECVGKSKILKRRALARGCLYRP